MWLKGIYVYNINIQCRASFFCLSLFRIILSFKVHNQYHIYIYNIYNIYYIYNIYNIYTLHIISQKLLLARSIRSLSNNLTFVRCAFIAHFSTSCIYLHSNFQLSTTISHTLHIFNEKFIHIQKIYIYKYIYIYIIYIIIYVGETYIHFWVKMCNVCERVPLNWKFKCK